jgi:hypothetical protein
MMSTSSLCVAKPARISANDAPAIAVSRSTPPVSWPMITTAATANVT